jgi:hypothetical protein
MQSGYSLFAKKVLRTMYKCIFSEASQQLSEVGKIASATSNQTIQHITDLSQITLDTTNHTLHQGPMLLFFFAICPKQRFLLKIVLVLCRILIITMVLKKNAIFFGFEPRQAGFEPRRRLKSKREFYFPIAQ